MQFQRTLASGDSIDDFDPASTEWQGTRSLFGALIGTNGKSINAHTRNINRSVVVPGAKATGKLWAGANRQADSPRTAPGLTSASNNPSNPGSDADSSLDPETSAPEQRSGTLEMQVHTQTLSSLELIVNLNACPWIKLGDVIKVERCSLDGTIGLLNRSNSAPSTVRVPSGNSSGDAGEGSTSSAVYMRVNKMSVLLGSERKGITFSIRNQTAEAFGLYNRTSVRVTVVKASDIELKAVQLVIRGQYVSRSDMALGQDKLYGSVVWEGRSLQVDDIRYSVRKLVAAKDGASVSCGAISPNTRVDFSSRSARVCWLIQLSQEMWSFGEDAKPRFERLISSVLRPLLKLICAANCDHYLTIILFARVTKHKEQSSDEITDEREDSRDYYEVIHEGTLTRDSPNPILLRVREAIDSFPRRVNWSPSGSSAGQGTKKVTVTPAAQGNFLEAINLVLNRFEKHHVDRDLHRTGMGVAVFTAGPIVLRVQAMLAKHTHDRVKDLGVVADCISVGPPPSHAVPVFIMQKDLQQTLRAQPPAHAVSISPAWLRGAFDRDCWFGMSASGSLPPGMSCLDVASRVLDEEEAHSHASTIPLQPIPPLADTFIQPRTFNLPPSRAKAAPNTPTSASGDHWSARDGDSRGSTGSGQDDKKNSSFDGDLSSRFKNEGQDSPDNSSQGDFSEPSSRANSGRGVGVAGEAGSTTRTSLTNVQQQQLLNRASSSDGRSAGKSHGKGTVHSRSTLPPAMELFDRNVFAYSKPVVSGSDLKTGMSHSPSIGDLRAVGEQSGSKFAGTADVRVKRSGSTGIPGTTSEALDGASEQPNTPDTFEKAIKAAEGSSAHAQSSAISIARPRRMSEMGISGSYSEIEANMVGGLGQPSADFKAASPLANSPKSPQRWMHRSNQHPNLSKPLGAGPIPKNFSVTSLDTLNKVSSSQISTIQPPLQAVGIFSLNGAAAEANRLGLSNLSTTSSNRLGIGIGSQGNNAVNRRPGIFKSSAPQGSIDWDRLVETHILPLTIDGWPKAIDTYTQLPSTHTSFISYYENDPLRLQRELICQRLTQDCQVVLRPNHRQPNEVFLCIASEYQMLRPHPTIPAQLESKRFKKDSKPLDSSGNDYKSTYSFSVWCPHSHSFMPRSLMMDHHRPATERWDFVDSITCGFFDNIQTELRGDSIGIPDVCRPRTLTLGLFWRPEGKELDKSNVNADHSLDKNKRARTYKTFLNPLPSDADERFAEAFDKLVSLLKGDRDGKPVRPLENIALMPGDSGSLCQRRADWKGFHVELAQPEGSSATERYQWLWVRHSGTASAGSIIRMEHRWLVASGAAVQSWITWLQRRAKQAGFTTLAIPTLPVFGVEADADNHTSPSLPWHRDVDPFLNAIPLRLLSSSHKALVQDLLRSRFGFVVDYTFEGGKGQKQTFVRMFDASGHVAVLLADKELRWADLIKTQAVLDKFHSFKKAHASTMLAVQAVDHIFLTAMTLVGL